MKSKNLLDSEVKHIISERKIKAESLADSNLNIALQNKDFKELFNKAKSMIYEIAKNEYQNKPTESLKKEFHLLKSDMENVLKTMGYQDSNFKPNYTCNICQDTGVHNGKYCVCYKKELSKAILETTGILLDSLPSFEKSNFEVFDKNIQEEMKTFYNKLEKYSTELNITDKKIITLVGGTGVGKTYLTECVVNKALASGAFTIFTTAFNLNNDMLKYHCAELENKNVILEPYLTCDLLVIDDLGSENILKNVTREYLYLLINERLKNNKNTIITTNLNFEKIRDNYDERIFSRIANRKTSVMLQMPGVDLRTKPLTKKNKTDK